MKSAMHYFLVVAAVAALSVSLLGQGSNTTRSKSRPKRSRRICTCCRVRRMSIQVTRTAPAAGSACSPVRTASSWSIRNTCRSATRCSRRSGASIPGPIRFLVNTHIHPDHTAGNATFAKLGAVLLAREELREGMARPAGDDGRRRRTRDPARLPVITYGMGDPVRFRMNGETVELIPVRAAHTGGDTMIRFVNADVIMVGDFYRNFGYPFIDVSNGGSLKGALEALELTMKIAGPNTKLIPGHGTFINRTDIVPVPRHDSRRADKVQQLIAQGKTEEEVLAAKVTAPYDAKVPGGLLPAGRRRYQRRPLCPHGVFAIEGR